MVHKIALDTKISEVKTYLERALFSILFGDEKFSKQKPKWSEQPDTFKSRVTQLKQRQSRSHKNH